MNILKKYLFITLLGFAAKTYSQNPDTAFLKKVQKAAASLSVEKPQNSDPVSVNSQLIWNKDKSRLAVIIKANILSGWHIYAYVPADQPYIKTDIVLELPEGITPLEEWTKPSAYPYEDNIFIYEGEIVFTRIFTVNNPEKDAVITVGLFYQTCDLRQCLPPRNKTKELKLKS
ncbi:protein-disulfide reductase DsbD domain-containing protein [Flavobacterium ajazii]|uniref:protein-disulfide reductase DsbD domain-containing protein n=1 Tax=Flavobacterium ajazii TaxID=2692318 RepID=UPI0013CF4D9E|nr:protein-disulfide reductase DsbD domain-containing protein [Flavobacterium ajazii]